MKKPFDAVVVALAILGAIYLYWQSPYHAKPADEAVPPTPPVPIVVDTPPAVEVPETSTNPSDSAVAAARVALGARLKIDPSDITLVEVKEATFIDGCLGLAPAGEICTQVLTDGYIIVMRAGGEIYTYRTNLTGSTVRFSK